MYKALVNLLDGTMQITYFLGALSIGVMMIHVTIHILSLYLFSFPLPGTYLVVSNYYMVTVTFLCIGLAERKNAHISVDFIYEMMPATIKGIFSFISTVLTALVFAAMGWRGLESAISKTKSGSYDLEYGIKFLTWPSYYLVPIGSALVLLVLLVKSLEAARKN